MKLETVLIVDDNETNRKLMRVILSGEGLNVFEAEDGVEALAILDHQPVDAVISDILMPNMDGYRLCYEIRNNARFRALPFMLYTSTYLSPSDENLALELGADKFLKKPSSAELIVQTLKDVMAHRRPADRCTIAPLQGLEVMKHYSQALITKLEEKNMELERSITERERVEAQLRQAQKMEAIGLLAGGIAHDFNNMLTVIVGYSDLMLQKLRADDPLRSEVEQVKEAGVRASLLTRQLLAFSRKQVLQPRVLDLNAILTNMDRMLQRLIGEDISLLTVPAPGLGRVHADPGQIEQVIMNLAVNARDAMPQGGKLTIETANVQLDDGYVRQHAGSKPGPHVMLAVSDTGCGMDAATQARIFEPFFTTKEPGKGTGLGLSTVYGIVKQSGGYIWVYSEPGHGTASKVYLPRVEAVAEAVEPSREAAQTPRGSETILLVEDDYGVRKLIHSILHAYGYRVVEAHHGKHAIQVCEQHAGPIHLMVTDVVMPEMSGRELEERLKPSHPDMKVLFMSGYTHKGIVHHGELVPGTAFLQKPFTPDALARKVREVLDALAKQ
jgi:two-component system cell cycle sensor histidine kinase/response regulator CckA